MKNSLQIIDSHTGGEPTRVVVDGFPDLGNFPVVAQQERFREDFDTFRRAIVNEPRGSDIQVGALLAPTVHSDCLTGVIFFNNVGYLGMCGHGMIGVLSVLSHLGKIKPGIHRIETAVGIVTTTLHEDGSVSFDNVPAYRYRKGVSLEVNGTEYRGDIAWGGNWFFLLPFSEQELNPGNIEILTDFAWNIRSTLKANGISGNHEQEIDHIELFSTSPTPGVNSRNFVLCPGKAYDRSPCGTGTSAKLCCLFEDGQLSEGLVWRQESIIGSVFEGRIKVINGDLIPTIKGTAYVNARTEIILDPNDPFCWGMPQE